MHNKLFDLIAQTVTLSELDKELCIRCFEAVSFPKNHVIEQAGKIPKYLYFVNSGFARLFHHNDKGGEVTTHINCPPGFITSYSGFIHQKASDEFLQSVTTCDLLRITKPKLDYLAENSAAIKNFSIAVFQQSITYNETRSKELGTHTAEQRYKNLMENYPDILHHVPVQYIASFLGMKPESLSRIRRRLN